MGRERRTFTKNEFLTAQPTKNDIFEIDWPKMDSLKCLQSGQSGVFVASFGVTGAVVIKSDPKPVQCVMAQFINA